RIEKEKFVDRIWAKDATLWKNDDAHKKIIANALGWLVVAEEMAKAAPELMQFADSVQADFDDVVVLGMGGSSLCSEVTRRLFGNRSGYPKLSVLDSTVPEAVRNLEQSINLPRTLFIVASKSGTTTEPMMFHRYFYDRVKSVKGDRAGESFIAVTDPDTQLVRDAQKDNFRRTFINMADIGGRYSALSYFGMVPAALSGVDVVTLLDRANHAAALLGIDAFDQPNVQESKDNTKRLLEEFKSTGKMTFNAKQVNADDAEAIGSLLAKVKAGDYVALTEYVAETPERDKLIAQ